MANVATCVLPFGLVRENVALCVCVWGSLLLQSAAWHCTSTASSGVDQETGSPPPDTYMYMYP